MDALALWEDRVTLIDDVITKGNTSLGAASRLAHSNGHVRIRVFTVLRAMGLQDDVEKIFDPCVGTITRRGDEAERSP